MLTVSGEPLVCLHVAACCSCAAAAAFQVNTYVYAILYCALARRHGRVALVGHSAGGWVARLLLGTEPYQGGCLCCCCNAGWLYWLAVCGLRGLHLASLS